jgi:ATP-dependent RNA helicase RhlE
MHDMGFIRDIRRVLTLLPAKRQNLLFSATFSAEIRRLADGLLHDPATIEVARRNADAELVSQSVHEVAQDRKRHALAHLIQAGAWSQVLVFTRTKHGANRLAEQLDRAGITATAIHGNKSQNARIRALDDFKEGKVRVLVATDIAARGLDIEALPHVVNYDLPHVAEDYVHRIGRTGRAGAEGEAVSLVSHEDRPLMAAIEKLMNRKVDSRPVEGFHPGSAAPRQEPRQEQQPRHNGQQRHRGNGQSRRNGQARGGNGQARGGNGQPRGNGQSRGNGQPRHDRQRRPDAQPQDYSAREDQIREARARMAAEGEKLPPRPSRAPARTSRQQRWDPRQDPRRAEPREPAYMQQPKPADPSRPAPVIQRKRSFAGMVGALLGRKRESEE